MNDGTADRPVVAGLHREDRDGVRMITLDRPEARNAFNDDLYDGVARALSEAASDEGIGACVIAAAIARAPRAAVIATKRLLLAARSDAVDSALRREFAELGRLVNTRR